MIVTKTDLLQYQKEAYNKLIKLKVGALYMAMGTGKTRTAIELIKERFNKEKINHVLWFCPCSVKKNLQIDIVKHSDGLLENTDIIGIESISKSDRIFVKTLELVQKYNCFLIIDESNLVKNHKALRTKRLIALSESCKYKLILNGTPITKNEADLYSQWYILDKRIFGYRSYYSFSANHLEFDQYGKVKRVLNKGYLTDKIAPYSFQINKEDCLDLPKKVYEDRWFDLKQPQMEHYREILFDLTGEIDEWNEATIYRLLTAMQLIVSGRYVEHNEKNLQLKHSPYFKSYKLNPRIEALRNILEMLYGKTIVWCRYNFEIEEVKELLKEMKLNYVEFHGGVKQKDRDDNLYKFEHDDAIDILLGNKMSGGYGLNLQFCNQMIYYSPDFDWGATKQSEDRIHRIGQKNTCFYYSIYSDTGIDNLIQKCLRRKGALEFNIRKMLNEKNLMEVLINDKDRAWNKTERKVN